MKVRLGVRLAVGFAISVGAVLLLVRVVDVPATVALLGSIDPVWLALPLVALGVQLVIRAWRWAFLLTVASATTVPTRRVVAPLTVGYFVNAVLPARLGEVARAVLVARREHLPIGSVAASVVVERVVDLAALLLIGLLATAALGAVGWPALALAGGLIVGLGVVVYVAPLIADRLPRRLPERARIAIGHFLGGIAAVDRRSFAGALLLSAMAWLGDVTTFWACARALGVDLGLPAVATIAVGAALGTALPAASGYLGTYELGAVAIGSIAGTNPDSILAIAVLAHVVAVVPIALVGMVSAVRLGVRFTMPAADDEAAGATATAGARRA